MEIVRLGQPTKGVRKKEEQKENPIIQVKVQPAKLPVAAIQGVPSQRQYCVFIFSYNKQTG